MKTGTYNKDYIRYADKYSHEIWCKLMDNFKNIKDYYIGCNEVSDIVLNAIIDTFNWLEKQGEHTKFINGIQVGDKVTRNEDGVLVNLSQLKRVAKPVEPMIVGQEPLYDYTNANICQKDFAEQKPAEWSEGDEKQLKKAIHLAEDTYEQREMCPDLQSDMDKLISWLKTLKDRVQPKQDY